MNASDMMNNVQLLTRLAWNPQRALVHPHSIKLVTWAIIMLGSNRSRRTVKNRNEGTIKKRATVTKPFASDRHRAANPQKRKADAPPFWLPGRKRMKTASEEVGEPYHYPESYIRLLAFVRLLFHQPSGKQRLKTCLVSLPSDLSGRVAGHV